MAQFHGPARSGWARLGRTGRVALGGGLAAVATGAVLVSQVVSVGHRPPASQAAAAEVLRAAAAHEAAQPAPPISPDKFVYVESVFSAQESRTTADGTIESTRKAKQRRIWLSVDGTRAGLLLRRPKGSTGAWQRDALPGCKDGRPVGAAGDAGTCTPHPAYQPDLPTRADQMRAYLYRNSHGDNPRDEQAFITAGDLIREAYLSPAQLAAVFGALAEIPGTTMVGATTDEVGRAGVAIAMPEARGARTELIFDPRTHAFLGERTTVVRAVAPFRAGDVVSTRAVLTTAVVDRVSQLP
ncbi:CU044_5270 family protein [Krasilnikovia sp. MM14-A1259]